MADVQSNFLEFHKKIRLTDDNEQAKLREKRQIIIDALEAGLAKYAEDTQEEKLSFTHFNQGSYAMRTGIQPKDGDYDIDVGLVFNCLPSRFENPVQLKKIVRDALDSNGRSVAIRRPCVTVSYMKDGEVDYHVDLAIYVLSEDDGDLLNLAVGRAHTPPEDQEWQLSDPKGLISEIRDRFHDDDAAQFRRVVRYLKKWREENFSSGGPISIALTCAAYHWFSPAKVLGSYVDLRALKNLVDQMLVLSEGGRLVVTLPVHPWTDLLGGMTEKQMSDFCAKLQQFSAALADAAAAESVEDACKALQKVFGQDFEVPSDDGGGGGGKTGTVKRSTVAPYVPTGQSAG